jgi:hypothetical protein
MQCRRAHGIVSEFTACLTHLSARVVPEPRARRTAAHRVPCVSLRQRDVLTDTTLGHELHGHWPLPRARGSVVRHALAKEHILLSDGGKGISASFANREFATGHMT